MSEERCVFPNSNNSVFSPTRSFPWHEERFGNQDLHTKLWKIFEKLERKECDKKKFQLTFKEVVKKILVGRQINLGIQGTNKGKLLMRADLPHEMEAEVARQLEYILPPTRSRVSFRRRVSTQNISAVPSIDEESLEDDEDVFGDSPGEFVSNWEREEQLLNEELEDAYDHFLDKLENLDAEDLTEITSALKSGLRSWLSFAQVHGKKEQVKSPHSSDDDFSEKGVAGEKSKIKVLFRETVSEGSLEKIVDDCEDMKRGSKSGRAAEALATIAKGDDKLTRKSEEQVSKITNDFCNWLKELPKGEDMTVNNTPPDKIRQLFDSTQVTKPSSQSKVVAGLRAWAKFGNEVIGMGVDMNAAANTFAKKEKAKKRFQDKTTRKALVAFVASGTHREVVVKKTSKKIKSGDKKKEEKPRLDHRNYGAWYLPPQKWEQRFQKMSNPKAIAQIKGRRVGKDDLLKATIEKEQPQQQVPEEIITDEGKLHSVRAFRSFLERRDSYEPPAFLKKALHIPM